MARPQTTQESATTAATRSARVYKAGYVSRYVRSLPLGRFALLGLFCAPMVLAQSGSDEDKQWSVESEKGIPVTSSLIREKCGGCHTPDDKGNLSRISWARTTPEGWAQVIRRMTRQHGLSLTPDETKQALKYLSAWHGLAPEEAKPVMYIPERRMITETNIPNESIRGACAACHSFGQPLSWRRTKVEWKLLQNMHVALYSQADAQFRQLAAATDVPGGVPTGAKPPMQGTLGLEYIARTAPLHTREWAAWRSRMPAPDLEGKWLVSARVPGKGLYFGTMTINADRAGDEFTTSATLRAVGTGDTLSRRGAATLYAGYAWRGKSTGGATGNAAPDDLSRELREALWFSPDQKSAEGRWYWGMYHEFGYNVKMIRTQNGPTVGAVVPQAVKAGSKGVDLHIFGDGLPAGAGVKDIRLGAGITINRIISASPTELVVRVDVDENAVAGPRDASVKSAALENAFPVYRSVDYLKVTPETALARLGDGKRPKGYQQFDVVGYDNGADGKPRTDDDVAIGPVDVDWSMDEFRSVYYDDDTKYVGSLSAGGLFTPAIDGPNPERRFGRNNYGDVWVVATAKSLKDKFGKPLTARAHMVVTVPAYMHWDQPEVTQ